ncbi:MAG: sigma-70 family RNA polymerase sigma factor [Planctomycetota bacterium]
MRIDSTDLTWLKGLARALLMEAHAADDLVQDTMVAALEGPLPAGAPPRAWLASVARRLVARRFRSAARRTQREQRVAVPETLPDPTELVARAEVAEQVTAAVRRLPEPFRRTILLRYLEGMSAEQIAKEDGQRVDTVRWRTRRGLQLLREELSRRYERDGVVWSVVLAPLASSKPGPATAGASAKLVGSVAVWSAMNSLKVCTFVVALAICWGLWFLATSQPVQTQDDSLVVHAPTPPAVDRGVMTENLSAPKSLLTSDPANVQDNATADEADDSRPTGLFGNVVDEQGGPIAGATVYLAAPGEDESGARKSARATILAQTASDEAGRFHIPPEDWPVADLGVSANGFLSALLLEVVPGRLNEEVTVVLERGLPLSGRVVDELGGPVPGLELLTHTADGTGVDHVSPSQTRLRAERAALADSASVYYQCEATSDRTGRVEFSGLPEGDLIVRALSPDWTIEEPQRVSAGDKDVLWIARQLLGVRLEVIDTNTGRPVERARATFHMDLTFADGTTEDYGQWVGRGAGEVSFAVKPKALFLPKLADRVITRAQFYGTVRSGNAEVKWRAEPVADPAGVKGLVEVRVEIDPTPEPATATVALSARYDDGSPFAGTLVTRWVARTEEAGIRKGVTRLEPLSSGDYEIVVPAGVVTLRVQEHGASGSLPTRQVELDCEAHDAYEQLVELPRGGTAIIRRPANWTGQWFVHASWRGERSADWQGSWNYSTEEDTLQLAALRPVEWRFQLRRESEQAPDPLVRTVQLTRGETVVVED